MKSILITGGNGYIAKSLFNNLSDDYEVTSISRSNFDLTNRSEVNNFFQNKYFDIVIHTAVIGGSRLKQENSIVLDSNLQMYYNLLENKSHFTKFLHFGSGAELYARNTPYGLSKYIINESLKEKENFYNIRIFGLFDEEEIYTRFIKGNIIRYIKGEPIQIFENKKMDFFYMRDLHTLVRHYIEKDNPPSEVNCSYDTKVSLKDIANKINLLSNYTVPIICNDTKGIDYIGDKCIIDCELIGLDKGINYVYSDLKK